MNKILLFLIIFIYQIYPQTPHNHFYNSRTTDKNNIHVTFNNIGSLVPSGTWNELGTYNEIVFDAGPWIVGKINGIPYAEISEWWSLYSPGPIINGQPGILVDPQDSLRFRIYKINKGDDDSNPDYAEWPDSLGAPVDQDGKPLIYGDQTLWSVFNGVDSTVNTRNLFDNNYFAPMPVEIRQTVFEHEGNYHDYENIFSNIVFIEWTIINKGNQPIDSVFFGFWSDIDFDPVFENLPAVDSANQIAYCWSDTTGKSGTVPAVGFELLYGPVVSSMNDTAIFKGRKLSGFKNLPMTSFHGIGDDSFQDPLMGPVFSVNEAWNVSRGLDGNGNVIINPNTNYPTKFPFNGDPVTKQGWLFPKYAVGGGAGILFFSGPFDLAPSDTQWAMIALIPGIGNSPKLSINYMRQKAELLKTIPYDSLAFGNISYSITDVKSDQNKFTPVSFKLFQNYPNPFNPATTIQYSVARRQIVSLKVYDILGKEVATLVNEEKKPGIYEVKFNGSKLSSGVYFYRLQARSFMQTKKMVLLK